MRFAVLGLCSILFIQGAWCEISKECLNCGKVLTYLDLASDMIEKARANFTCVSRPETKPIDCADLFHEGHKKSGVYEIWPVNRLFDNTSINVFCDMDTDEGGWTVIQRRGNFNNSKDYFYKDWESYKKGFGELKEEFWFGNDKIFALTNQRSSSIRFDLEDYEGAKAYAVYDEFLIDDEYNKYRLHIAGYSGTAGDSMIPKHNTMFFTTKDRKNDNNKGANCAEFFKGAWWHNACHSVNLNGLRYAKGETVSTNSADSISWATFRGEFVSMNTAEMKIRPRNFQPSKSSL